MREPTVVGPTTLHDGGRLSSVAAVAAVPGAFQFVLDVVAVVVVVLNAPSPAQSLKIVSRKLIDGDRSVRVEGSEGEDGVEEEQEVGSKLHGLRSLQGCWRLAKTSLETVSPWLREGESLSGL